MRFSWVVVFVGCSAAPPASELESLRKARDYFSLREELESVPDRDDPETLLLRAVVQHAFNELEESNRTLDRILDLPGLGEDHLFEARALVIKNYARQFRYREAHETSELVLGSPVPPERGEDLPDLKNASRLLKALVDVPPQTSAVGGTAEIQLDPSRRVPLRIGDAERTYTFDTGANLSVLMRSEALGLGLTIRPAGVEVGTSTDRKITGDVAVADRVAIGTIEYRHVVFLVLDDEHLSFPGGFRIPGIIGFPLIEAMGAVTFRADGTLRISGRVSAPRPQNVALEELVPLVRVRYRGEPLVCRLDTGASATDFYEPFFARYRPEIEALGSETLHETGGAGGIREIAAFVLPEIEVEIGEKRVTLRNRPVYTKRIVDEKDNYLFCNVGLDLLGQFPEYTIDFRAMSLVPGS